MEFHEYDTRLGAYAVIVDDEERVLLALWNEDRHPRWTLPGGGVEVHESPEEGAVREVLEETGYVVELDRLLGVKTKLLEPERRLDGAARALKHVQVVFEAHVVGGELTHEVGGTTDLARWIPLAEVASLPRVAMVDVALGMREPLVAG